MLLVLHLHDKLLAFLVRAIHVINQAAVFLIDRKQFLIKEMNVLHLPLAVQQGIEEVNQQVLVDFLTEDALEATSAKGLMNFDIVF